MGPALWELLADRAVMRDRGDFSGPGLLCQTESGDLFSVPLKAGMTFRAAQPAPQAAP